VELNGVNKVINVNNEKIIINLFLLPFWLPNYSQCSEVFQISVLAFNLANYQVPLQLSRPATEIVAKSSRMK